MRCECCPNDTSKFATGLRIGTPNHLIWDSAKGQDVIIVQTPFGQDAEEILDDICHALEEVEELSNQFIEILNNVWICYVSATDKARNNGCILKGEGSTYTVFSCEKNDEGLKIYRSQIQAMVSPSCDIPLEIHVEIMRELITKGVIFKKTVETGFYLMSFPTKLADNYIDGSLSYQIGEFKIPVTKEMIRQGVVYIQSNIQPIMVPKDGALKIV